ncbi:MAG: nucleotidyltransferase domain-containing protein [Actinomycetota bacterium]|jgi:predicted nucleotidyltransferase|nr:nucleotidyltransferase domain-containing protein [Actinomycetota bacterium]
MKAWRLRARTSSSTSRRISPRSSNAWHRSFGYFTEKRYRGLVLYGSYARGEADEGSDVDLLLLLEGEVDSAAEIIRGEEIEWPLSLKAGYTTSLFPVGVDKYRRSEQPFLRNARGEEVTVS